MAQDSKFEIHARIEWKTEVAFKSIPRTSPSFSLLGSEWHLEFSYHIQRGDSSRGYMDFYNYYHAVSLVPNNSSEDGGDEELQRPFSVVTYVSHPEEASRAPVGWRSFKITKKSRVILWYAGDKSDTLLKKLDWLVEVGVVRFVCLFYDAEPSTDVAKTESKYLSPGENRSHPLRTDSRSVELSPEVPWDMETLTSDYSRMLEEEILPDVKLECGGRTFQAHRSVLAARSEIFRAMFRNKMLESETGAVEIKDMDAAVLEMFLKYLYSGRLDDLSGKNADSLYKCADKYAVFSLKTACSYWITRDLTEETCVSRLEFSDSHSDPDLKAAVMSFITQNPSVMKSESWLSLSKEHPVLASEVLQAYVASTV